MIKKEINSPVEYVSIDGSTLKTTYIYEVTELNEIKNIKINKAFLVIKRFFDIFASILLSIFLLIPSIIICIIICIDSKGNPIYKQERMGKNGKLFEILKFRTMNIDAEKNGPVWADDNDSRVTKVGRVLRKFRIDEIPQLLNILKGDMSFVGPRPERKVFYNEFEKYIHGFSVRLSVTPGLTGLAQISGGYDLLPEEKIIYDIEYIKNMSIIMDLKCLLTTVGVSIFQKGAR